MTQCPNVPMFLSLNLLSLADSCLTRDSFQNLICDKTDSLFFLQHVSFRVSVHPTRNVAPFNVMSCAIDYQNNKPFTHCMR